jgi:hypothetical protein
LPDKIPDGAELTVIASEAGESVPWTKPAELAFPSEDENRRMAALRADRVSMVFAD